MHVETKCQYLTVLDKSPTESGLNMMWLDVCVCIRVSSSSYAMATHTSGIVDRFVLRVCEMGKINPQ